MMGTSTAMKRERKYKIRRKGRRVTCLRCGWTWAPFTNRPPKRCANPACRSPYWNVPRQQRPPDA
jgi:hypothetical protein